ncbi:MAG: gamma-glutamyltransferase [Candidimonas sp.]
MHLQDIRRFTKAGLLAAAIAALSACAVSSPPSPQALSPAVHTAAAPNANAAYDYDLDVFLPVIAHNGMVATQQEIASQVGLDILRQGGNAIDAAVGIGFALAVTLPYAGNIGGGGFMIIHDAKTGQDIALDFRETAPSQAHRDMFLDTEGNVIDKKSLLSHYAVGVPGTVAGLEHALKKWGSMPLSRLVAPAISLAENGFAVSQSLADTLIIKKEAMSSLPESQAIFWRNGEPLKAGDLLVQKDLGLSLRQIAEQGSHAFYRGDIARKIAREMAPYPGTMTLQDLADFKVVEREPIIGTYRGYEIVTMPPPSSGGAHLVQILNILERWPLAQWGSNSDQTIHYMAESMKLAYADRAEYLGDPDFVEIPLKGLTSKRYADELAKQVGERARPAELIKPGVPQQYESDETTHYSVVDKEGNAVSVTYTLNGYFGTGIVAAGTGILLNNEMDDFSVKPGAPNLFKLIGGEKNAVQANKRPLSSMTPTIVLKDRKPYLVTGSPGGARIITTVLQVVVNAIDFNMNPAESIATPRFHHQWLPDELRIEKGFSPDTLRLLARRGHTIDLKPSMGRTQSIQIRDDGSLHGYSDPRRPDGKTLGY